MTDASPSRRAALALAPLALLAVSACSSEEPAEQTSTEPTDETLATAISETDELSTVAAALTNSGLAQVFDGAGSYTIFAPTDAAFEALGETGAALRAPGQGAAMAAILRDHIVPGYLTPDDIEAAIEAQGGTVRVETMGDRTLTFTGANDGIRVSSEDGSSAMITGEVLKARNGVAVALDGVLKNVAAQAE